MSLVGHGQKKKGRCRMLEIFLTNLGKYNEGELVGKWVVLPCEGDELETEMRSIGIDGVQYEEWFITDTESNIDGLSDLIGEYCSIDTLNELAHVLDGLDNWEMDKVKAIIDAERPDLEDLLQKLDDLDSYDLFSSVHNEEDLGYFYIDECGALEIPENIQPYFDYESFGRDVAMDENGTFTAWGYLFTA